MVRSAYQTFGTFSIPIFFSTFKLIPLKTGFRIEADGQNNLYTIQATSDGGYILGGISASGISFPTAIVFIPKDFGGRISAFKLSPI